MQNEKPPKKKSIGKAILKILIFIVVCLGIGIGGVFGYRYYKQKNKNYQQNYLQHTVNFKKIEDAALSWEIEKYGKHSNRFPDEHYS